MIRFECDYNNGCCPEVLARLAATNDAQTPGYGEDVYSDNARALIRTACNAPAAAVYFLTGGTQANLTVITALLRPHQGVVCAETGHIATHESGAIEATGHKVLPLQSADGKLTAQQVQALHTAHWADENREHTVQPGMVYISQPTENGTVYTKQELAALYDTCKACGLPLYIDGARLGYALAAQADITLPGIAALCDAFTIGGTKVGALFGEALVVPNPELRPSLRYIIKQRGGLLAKGRLLGVQFEALFTDDLYMGISRHAVEQAQRIKCAFAEKDYTFRYDSPTNQQFPILPDESYQRLAKKYAFSFWEKPDAAHTLARVCTSWATSPADVDRLVEDIQGL